MRSNAHSYRNYYSWSKEFLEAGKKRLAGDTGLRVVRDVAFQLREPVALVGPRAPGDFAGGFGVLMPETAVNEYDLAPTRKDQVGFAGEVLTMKPVAVSHGMGNPAHRHLGLRSGSSPSMRPSTTSSTSNAIWSPAEHSANSAATR